MKPRLSSHWHTVGVGEAEQTTAYLSPHEQPRDQYQGKADDNPDVDDKSRHKSTHVLVAHRLHALIAIAVTVARPAVGTALGAAAGVRTVIAPVGTRLRRSLAAPITRRTPVFTLPCHGRTAARLLPHPDGGATRRRVSTVQPSFRRLPSLSPSSAALSNKNQVDLRGPKDVLRSRGHGDGRCNAAGVHSVARIVDRGESGGRRRGLKQRRPLRRWLLSLIRSGGCSLVLCFDALCWLAWGCSGWSSRSDARRGAGWWDRGECRRRGCCGSTVGGWTPS